MNRRELLKCLAAGGMVVAGELWTPGKRLISIPSGKIYRGPAESLIVSLHSNKYGVVAEKVVEAWYRSENGVGIFDVDNIEWDGPVKGGRVDRICVTHPRLSEDPVLGGVFKNREVDGQTYFLGEHDTLTIVTGAGGLLRVS